MLFLMMSLGMLYAQVGCRIESSSQVPSDYVITHSATFIPYVSGRSRTGETVLVDGRIRFAQEWNGGRPPLRLAIIRAMTRQENLWSRVRRSA